MVKNLFFIATLSIFLFFNKALFAQEQVVLITQKSGQTYLYQKRVLKNGLKMDVFRKSETEGYEKLNQSPIQRVSDGISFRAAVGEEFYQQVQADLQTDNTISTYLNLMNNPERQHILSFINPQVAKALGFLYVDETSKINQNYTYKLVYTAGNDSLNTNEIEMAHFSSPSVPTPPFNLGISTIGEQLEMEWEMPGNSSENYINGMNIYAESPNGQVLKINENLILKTNNSHFSYRFSLPFDNTTYNFFMKSQDMTGQESTQSEVLTMTLKDQTAPEPVDGLVANSHKGNPPVITWRVNLDNDLKGYNIYRAPRTVDTFVKINEELLSPFENFYKDETVVPGRKYAYAVTSVDSAGNESAKSSRATLFIEDYEQPNAPVNLVASFIEETEEVELNWEFGFSHKDFRTFQILRKALQKNQKSPFEIVNPKVLRLTNYTDQGPTNEGFLPGYIYKYYVIAIDSSSNASDTATVIFQIPDLDPPSPPEVKVSNDNGHRINITWTASTDYDVVAYKIYRNQEGEDSLLAENHYSQRMHRDETAIAGNIYIYSVAAVDSLGNEGMKSKGDTILMKDFNPPASTRNVFANAIEEGVLLKWEKVPDNDLTGYLIFRSKVATGVYEQINTSPITSESFLDSSGVTGDWYKVKAVDSSGNVAYIKNGVQAINNENQ